MRRDAARCSTASARVASESAAQPLRCNSDKCEKSIARNTRNCAAGSVHSSSCPTPEEDDRGVGVAKRVKSILFKRRKRG